MTGAMPAPVESPEFVILTGALGSGKTSLLKAFLEHPDGGETGIIVNDAGEINVDGAILESASGRPVTRAANGCICCAGGDDLQQAVDDLLQAHDSAGTRIRRIILETSGLAEPGPVVRAVGQLRQDRFTLRVVATLDAGRAPLGPGYLPQEPAQLAAAQSIVLTKLDLCDAAALDNARQSVRTINPLAGHIVTADPSARAYEAFCGDSKGTASAMPTFLATPAMAHPRIAILLARWVETPAWPDIEEWLEDMAGFCGARLLRVKGILAPGGGPERILVNAVGRTFARPQRFPDADAAEGLVLILRDIDTAALARFSAEVSACPPVLTAR